MHALPGVDGRRWLVLGLLSAAQLMLIVDVTVVNVALPAIGRDLGLEPAALTWVATAYTLFFGSLLLLGGRLADRFGRRRIFLTGLLGFTAASLASALAPDGAWLIGARIAQGVGAALLAPSALAIVSTAFSGPERARALSVWAAVGGSGAAIGVLLGGLLAGGPGWHWIFLVNVPIGVAIAAATMRLVPHTPGRPGSGLDLLGAGTAVATVGLVLYGLIRSGTTGLDHPEALVPLGLGLLAAVAFVIIENRVPSPLVPRSALRAQAIGRGVGLMLVAAALMGGTYFLASFYLQAWLALSPLATGLIFLGPALAIIGGAHLGSTLVARRGARTPGFLGLAIASGGAAVLARIPPAGDPVVEVLPGLAAMSFGLGLALVAATTTAFSQAANEDAGIVAGLVNTGHELGFAVGVAALGAIAAPALIGGGSFDALRTAFLAGAVGAAIAALVAATSLGSTPLSEGERPAFAH